jgi:sigma-E factor negative regulatory protein RseB
MMRIWKPRSATLALAVVVLLTGIDAFAASPSKTSEAASEQGAAKLWLKKIQSAAQKLNYSGTFVYQQASQVRTSRITHVIDAGHEIEKLEVLDGTPREYIRNNDEIVCYVPETKTLLVEKRVTRDVFPALLATNPSELAAYYSVKLAGSGRIAGHDSQGVRRP